MKTLYTLFVSFFFATCIFPASAQKNDSQAKQVLDATAKRINGASGIDASFKITNFVAGNEQGAGTGNIQIKGKKYKVTTGDQISWFDGKTLWNYSSDIEEVNVTIPTRKELQSMNPYAFVTLYKHGYKYSMQKVSYNGKEMYDVKLIAEKSSSDIPEIIITISKDYTPACIRMRQGKNWNRITITKFNTSKTFNDSYFTFPSSQYPDAEIIDMR